MVRVTEVQFYLMSFSHFALRTQFFQSVPRKFPVLFFLIRLISGCLQPFSMHQDFPYVQTILSEDDAPG